MFIREKLPPGHIYMQLSQAPITTYADFLNFSSGGQTLDDNNELTTAPTVQNAMFKTAIASGHLARAKNVEIPNEFLVDVSLNEVRVGTHSNHLGSGILRKGNR